MSLQAIKNKLTSNAGRQVLKVQKHSPVLLFGAGLVGVGTTVVLACRATLKMEEILHEAEKQDELAQSSVGKELKDGGTYSEDDAKQDRMTNKVKTAIKIAGLYAPAIAVGTLTVGALTGSHVILSRRNAGLAAAYGAVQKAFTEYRERVVGEFGEEKDREFRYGVEEREMAVETDEGVSVKTVKGAKAAGGRSMYAKIFDEGNKNWQRQYTYNAVFIRAQQNYANDILQSRGHLFLNDVYDMLGFDRTKAGAVVGWVKNGNGDNYVDFGIVDSYEGMRFINGDERSVLLDFNVDGVVYDLLED